MARYNQKPNLIYLLMFISSACKTVFSPRCAATRPTALRHRAQQEAMRLQATSLRPDVIFPQTLCSRISLGRRPQRPVRRDGSRLRLRDRHDQPRIKPLDVVCSPQPERGRPAARADHVFTQSSGRQGRQLRLREREVERRGRDVV